MVCKVIVCTAEYQIEFNIQTKFKCSSSCWIYWIFIQDIGILQKTLNTVKKTISINIILFQRIEY